MKILIACGGTGGHIFPGLSLARELRERGHEVLLVGTDHPLEVKLFGSFGLPYRLMPAAKVSADPAGFLKFLIKFTAASLKSTELLFKHKPDIVVGFGGYASFSVCGFAAVMGKPLFLHEQNCEAGLANRILALLAKRVAISFRETEKTFGGKAVFTGNPIRRELLSANKKEALEHYKIGAGKFTILVLGGSQGSKKINTIFGDMLGMLSEGEKRGIGIIHIAGIGNYNDVYKKYEKIRGFPSPYSSPQRGEESNLQNPLPNGEREGVRGEKLSGVDGCVYDFLEDISYAYAMADLVVSRAGATALFEIAALGIPSILIPYRFAGGHQYYNASALEKAGGTIVMEEPGLTPQALKDKIFELKNDTAKLRMMSDAAKGFAVPDAAERFADLICKKEA